MLPYGSFGLMNRELHSGILVTAFPMGILEAFYHRGWEFPNYFPEKKIRVNLHRSTFKFHLSLSCVEKFYSAVTYYS